MKYEIYQQILFVLFNNFGYREEMDFYKNWNGQLKRQKHILWSSKGFEQLTWQGCCFKMWLDLCNFQIILGSRAI